MLQNNRMMQKKLKFLRDVSGMRGYCEPKNMMEEKKTTNNVGIILRFWQTKGLTTLIGTNVTTLSKHET